MPRGWPANHPAGPGARSRTSWDGARQETRNGPHRTTEDGSPGRAGRGGPSQAAPAGEFREARGGGTG